jgi:hypothetical protein
MSQAEPNNTPMLPERRSMMTLLLFDEAPSFALGVLQAAYRHAFSDDAPHVAPLEDDSASKDTGVLQIHDSLYAILMLPAPVPGDDLASAVDTSPWFPDVAEVIAAHRCHLFIHARAPGALDAEQTLLQARTLTRLTAIAAALFNATAVKWVSVESMHQPEQVADYAAQPYAVNLWARLWMFEAQLADGSIGIAAQTQGLACFTGGELAIPAVPVSRHEEMGERAEQIMHYLLFNGPVFADGDTLTVDETCNTQIRYENTEDGGVNFVIPL